MLLNWSTSGKAAQAYIHVSTELWKLMLSNNVCIGKTVLSITHLKNTTVLQHKIVFNFTSKNFLQNKEDASFCSNISGAQYGVPTLSETNIVSFLFPYIILLRLTQWIKPWSGPEEFNEHVFIKQSMVSHHFNVYFYWTYWI